MTFAASLLLAPLLLGWGAPSAQEPKPPFDLLIEGGLVFDGLGNPGRMLDLGIRGVRIAAIGDLQAAATNRRIDATGLVVSPGFIDTHAHADRSARRRPRAENYLAMGVTSLITGNCGTSELDLSVHFAKLEATGISLNYGSLVGHSSLRLAVMGSEARAPSTRELEEMQRLLRAGLQAGALGMSTGLIYVPGTYAKIEELIALARVVAEFDGLYASHMRNEADHVLDAISEALQIGAEAGIPVHLSHLKAMGKPNWGRGEEIIAMLVDARAAGREVTGDQYAYTASSTSLDVLFPTNSLSVGRQAFASKLADDAKFHAEMGRALLTTMEQMGFGDFAFCQIASAPGNSELNGKNLAEAATQFFSDSSRKQQAEAAMRLMIDAKGARVSMVYHKMSEADVATIMQAPFISVAADAGIIMHESVAKPHPRGAGNNPRVLGRYVRELELLSLPLAILKMTSLPAKIFDLVDRGEIKQGAYADLVIFDAERIIDGATYKHPLRKPEGIEFVIVNGRVVVEAGEHNGATPGMLLRRRR